MGAEWRLFMPHNRNGLPNIVGQAEDDEEVNIAEIVAGRICYCLLLQEGEDVFHPMVGLAPKLFDNLNNDTPTYFVYHASKSLDKWNRLGFIGYTRMKMEIEDPRTYGNFIYVNIEFDPIDGPENNVLSFEFFKPKVFHPTTSGRELLKSISLNNETFDLQRAYA